MNPNNGSQSGGGPNPPTPQDERAAAANVLRTQIDAMYGDRTAGRPEPRREAEPSVYERNHEDRPQPQPDQWKAYHTAWQNYYQQYYEAYYAHQQAAQQAIQGTAAAPTSQVNPDTTAQATPETNTANQHGTTGYFSAHTDLEETAEDLSKDQALYELREKLLGKVRHQAKQIRKSRHFIPIAASLAVVFIFLFLQYNRVLLSNVNAYISPGSIDPQNIVIDPTSSSAVSPDPRLIIPKINVDVPTIYGIGPDYDSQMKAMESGVAHFAIPGANSRPGEVGNTVISGHSSNDLFDGGDYKFIFAQLEKIAIGDTIYANYEGTRYTYIVTKKEVVLPTQVNKLIYPTDKPILTLITCTPLGTAQKRLLVTAEQVSPDPAAATSAPAGSGEDADGGAAIPGNSPTFLERLFGA